MDKSKEFLIKIKNKNELRRILKEKKNIYSKLKYVPEALDECLSLKEEINYIESELSKY